MQEKTILKDSLKVVLEIQELDVKMIRLMRIKNDRKKELKQIEQLKSEILQQKGNKEEELLELKKTIRITEGELEDLKEKIAQHEKNQKAVKKLEEFNALSQAINQSERKKTAIEQNLSDASEELSGKEDELKQLKKDFDETELRSLEIIKEIEENLAVVNEEGSQLQTDRTVLAEKVNNEVLKIYEKLLKNKKDRVVVPIENRVCQGCYITLTAQHENLVRKGEKLVFCEYCSRIHFWPEGDVLEGTAAATSKRRRRKLTTTTTTTPAPSTTSTTT
jgi:uncharacterized protein